MSTRSWFRNLFAQPATRTIRKAPQRALLTVDALEDRLVPSTATDHILVQYKNDGAVHKVAIDPGVTVDQALADYSSRGSVATAEADPLVSVTATFPNDSLFPHDYGLNNTTQAIPADPYVGTAGTLDADIDAPEAWDITRGSTTTTVAIIDTGIQYSHIDLYLNIWINQREIPADIRARLTDVDGDGAITFRDLNNSVNKGTGKITDLNGNSYIDGGDLIRPYNANGSGGWADGINQDPSFEPAGTSYADDLIGWDFRNHDNDPYDDTANSHGTHVAGVIGAIGNNGRGVAGVNWVAQMAALKFLPASGSGLTSDAVAALDYAVAKGIKISNNSWGGYGGSEIMYNSILNAKAAGHIFVNAAGNGGSDNIGDNNDDDTNPFYPASYDLDNIIAVAATDNTDTLTSFSNYGATRVDVAAPGWEISSTYNNNTYAYISGTSMASPYVTGVVALVASAKQGLTYDQLIHQVLGNVDVVSSLTDKVASDGRLNAYKAVSSPGPNTDAPMIASLTPNVAADTSISSVRLTFTEAIGNNPGTGTFSFTTADVSGFTGPNGAAITATGIQAVANSDGKAFDIIFARQTAGGTYRLTLGPNIYDTAGNAMNQDGDFTPGEVTQDQYKGQFVLIAPITFTGTTSVKINDQSTVRSPIVVNQSITIGDVNVKVNLKHNRISDLRLTLISPTGTRVTLLPQAGGTGVNMTNTVFDDEAGMAFPTSANAAPFTGSFWPASPLNVLDGTSARDTWMLEISDLVKGTAGTLTDWSLIFIPAGSGTGSSLSLSGNGPAGLVVSGQAPVAPMGLGNVAANIGPVDWMLPHEQVPSSSRVADRLRFAPRVAIDRVSVQGKAEQQAPSRSVGHSGTAHGVDTLRGNLAQLDRWQDEDAAQLV